MGPKPLRSAPERLKAPDSSFLCSARELYGALCGPEGPCECHASLTHNPHNIANLPELSSLSDLSPLQLTLTAATNFRQSRLLRLMPKCQITANPDRGTTDQAVFWARVRKTAIIQSTDFGSQYYKALIGLRDNSSGRSPTLTR